MYIASPGRTTAGTAAIAVAALVAMASAAASDTAAAIVEVTTPVAEYEGGVGGLAVDRLGFVYVADFGEKVWKVSPYGDVEVLADTLYGASGNAVDAAGSLYQSSFWGNSVSRIDRDGTVTVVATGLQGPVGIAIDEGGDLVVCNCNGNSLSRVTPGGQVSRFAASELFNCPNGIARDADGNFFVVNFSDSRMLKVSADGVVDEFAQIPGGGNGHVAFAAGELFVTGFRSNRVYRVTLAGEVSTLAGNGVFSAVDGAGLEASFASPNGIAYDSTRDVLYTNDYLTPFLRRNFERGRSAVRRIRFPNLTERFLAALEAGGIEAAVQAYRDYKQSRPRKFTEIETNVLAYRLLQQGQVDEAIEVFRLNVESYPRSWNVYDSLAEGYKVRGDRERAIEYYRKSLELNPGNLGAMSQLKELGAD